MGDLGDLGEQDVLVLKQEVRVTEEIKLKLKRDSTDFESVWVEVENNNRKNYLFCCAYRHPSSVIDTFNEYLQEILSNPAVCNKQVFLSLETSTLTF